MALVLYDDCADDDDQKMARFDNKSQSFLKVMYTVQCCLILFKNSM